MPITTNTLIAEYAGDKAIIYNNADPLITSTNLKNHLHLTEKWYNTWRFKANNQDKSQYYYSKNGSMSQRPSV